MNIPGVRNNLIKLRKIQIAFAICNNYYLFVNQVSIYRQYTPKTKSLCQISFKPSATVDIKKATSLL